MGDDVVIRATGLGKSYTRYKSRVAMMLDRLQGTTRRGEAHWALRDVSFEVKRGEFFGVIGRNGAGKSTLLQLLAGVLQPTEGSLEVKGKVLALLELGASFDPLSTGRENCRVQMALFGIPAAQVDAKIKAVEEFAEVGEAFDEPVKTYSSGMFVRVAFAVNTTLAPDVLLVDEALAVGDVFFHQKCFARLDSLREAGTTVILVSHDVGVVAAQCTKAMVIGNGAVRFVGAPTVAVDTYVDEAHATHASDVGVVAPASEMGREAAVELVSFRITDAAGREARSFTQGDDLLVQTIYRSTLALEAALPGIELEDGFGRRAHARNAIHDRVEPPGVPAGRLLRTAHTLRLDLAPGEYTLRVGLSDATRDIVAHRDTLAPGDLWSSARILHRSGKLAVITVTLPEQRHPFRETFVGYAPLPASISIEVLP